MQYSNENWMPVHCWFFFLFCTAKINEHMQATNCAINGFVLMQSIKQSLTLNFFTCRVNDFWFIFSSSSFCWAFSYKSYFNDVYIAFVKNKYNPLILNLQTIVNSWFFFMTLESIKLAFLSVVFIQFWLTHQISVVNLLETEENTLYSQGKHSLLQEFIDLVYA